MILTGYLGVIWKHGREHASLDVISGQVCRARAEAALLVQRETAAVIQHGEFVHVNVHASLVCPRQFRPRAQADDRDTHARNDNAT